MIAACCCANAASAAATCSPAKNFLGYEFIAVDGPNAAGEFYYYMAPIRCESGQIRFESNVGLSQPEPAGWKKPADVLANPRSVFGSYAPYRMFVSSCGSNLIFTHNTFTGTVGSVNTGAYAASNSTAYVDVFASPIYLQSGKNVAMRKDAITAACVFRPDSGRNAGAGKYGATCNGTNPINPAWRGNKYQRETDYVGAGSVGLELSREYNSRSSRVAGLTPLTDDSNVGGVWTHSYSRSVQLFAPPDGNGLNTVQSAAVARPDGSIVVFNPSGGNWVAAVSQTTEKLLRLPGNGWLFMTDDNAVETYDANGRLIAITTPDGRSRTVLPDASGRVQQVTDAFGRALSFIYDGTSTRILSATGPDAQPITLGYTGGKLTSVTYPGSQARSYRYENAAFPAALTAIDDESSQRYANWLYDGQGRAYSSEHGAAGSGLDRATVAYNADGSATITDAINSSRTFSYVDQFDTGKPSGVNQPAGSGCLAATNGITYSPTGFVQTRTDFNGYRTNYTTNARGLETQRVEGLNTNGSVRPESRTISTDWHAYWRLPIRMAEPRKLSTYVYNGDLVGGNPVTCAPAGAVVPSIAGGTRPIGVLCSRTEQATTDTSGSQGFAAVTTGTPRTWTYTYDQYGNVLTADGPRTDVQDKTTYTYHPANDPVLGKRGNLASVTNAAGHLTQFTDYDANGRVLTMIDPNNVTTTFTYWPRGWLKTRVVAGKTTSYDYTPWGGLEKITYPDNTWVHYGYDAAHRLTGIGDSANRQVSYILDGLGNRTKETYQNADGTVAREVNRVFDALGRLKDEIEGVSTNAPRTFGYYANGEGKFETTPKQDTTSFDIDALGRTIKQTDPVNGPAKPTLMSYDSLDQLTNLTAPNNAATGFTVDGLGNVTQEVSADRGTTNATYDDAGNLKTRTDARGVTATYAWDAINRLIGITYPDSADNFTYTWDAGAGCSNGIGRLCQVTDANGSTRFSYDNRGNLVTRTRLEGGETFTTTFAYNEADRALDVITPTAETLAPTLDASGRVNQLRATNGANATVVAKDIDYSANGQIRKQTLGQGTSITQSFDSAGRPDVTASTTPAAPAAEGDVPLPLWAVGALGAALAGLIGRSRKGTVGLLAACALGLILASSPDSHAGTDLDLNYDANGNVIQKVTPGGTNTYTYDALDRVDTETGPAGARNHDFDPNDNRTTDGAGTTTTYTPNSDRLATINGVPVTLDAAGNLTGDGTYKYVWNGRGDLKELRKADNTLLATYFYDDQHLRTRKVTTAAALQGATITYYHYDVAGHLIAETAPGNQPKATYVWNGDTLTGFITYNPRTVYTVQVDQIGSPFQIRKETGTVMWRWESEAFGRTAPNEDVDGDGTALTFNLRFPGQYFDKESGLNYNWHRYYSPRLSRYISSDPAGVDGGENSYGYAAANPLGYSDRAGLQALPKTTDPVWPSSRPVAPNPQPQAANDPRFRVGVPLRLVGAGIILMCIPGNSGADKAACNDDPQRLRQECRDQDCQEIQEKIQTVMKQLTRRFMHQCRDKKNQWDSHLEAYDNTVKNLGRLIKEAEDEGCPVPQKARDWMETECPLPGTDRNSSPGY